MSMMRCEVRFEYDLPMCVEDDDVCIPVNLTIPMEFMIRDIEVVATDSPLSHLCSILVSFGEEVIYNGPIGKHGFIMSIIEMEERGEYALGILADCSSLHSLISEPMPPCKIIVKGYYLLEDKEYPAEFSGEWL